MAVPDITEPTVFGNLILLALGLLNVYSIWRAKRDRIEQKKEIAVVAEKQEVIHKLVNSPMGVVLESLAVALEQIARASRNETDIIAAVTARQRFNEHSTKEASMDASRVKDDADKQKIIADFLKTK